MKMKELLAQVVALQELAPELPQLELAQALPLEPGPLQLELAEVVAHMVLVPPQLAAPRLQVCCICL